MLHQVGVGVLGPVFRTYEPTRDRLVAVKVFRLDITPEQAQSLADELAKAAEAGLFHPSIVEPIAAGVEGTVAYRAEEYVAAESLDVAMRHYAPAPIDKVLPFITQLAGAIDFARTAGIGHGALHPRDVFVTPDEARATGFGVVEALDRVGLRAPVRRPYTAPERVAGSRWATPADVFSLAVIAYELLTARRPAGTGGDIGALTGAVLGEHQDAVFSVLARAMEDDPAWRYPSALAFASALEAAARRGATERGGLSLPAVAVPAAAAGESPEPVTDDEIDEMVADMPPPHGIDEHEEPAEAAREEDVFRADQPELDDIAAEQHDDEAHMAFAREESADAEEGDFFDEEAVEDLALDAAPLRDDVERNRFSDDFTLPAVDEVPEQDAEQAPEEDYVEPLEPADVPAPVVRSRGHASVTEPAPMIHERQRPAILPYAVVLILGLLVGFGAGLGFANRQAAQRATETARGPETPAAATPAGKEYSEQAVAPATPPAEPPSIPTEAPDPAPAAPVAKPPAATTGKIVITSTPPRAGVTVDGVWRGRTPLTLDKLKFGSYTVRVVQPGFAVAREDVRLTPQAAERTIAMDLKPTRSTATAPPAAPGATTGSLYVDSRPRGARVMIDGRSVGVTPLELTDVAAGPHAVTLELQDHRVWRTRTEVVAGRRARVTGSLERIK